MAAIVAIANALEVVGVLQAAETSIRLSLDTDTRTTACQLNLAIAPLSTQMQFCRSSPSPVASSAGPSRP
jgi:hypothetical protein